MWKEGLSVALLAVFFFFQAEDGIRDVAVTGVQTCALPIFARPALGRGLLELRLHRRDDVRPERARGHAPRLPHDDRVAPALLGVAGAERSEERRVGKDGRSRRTASHSKTSTTRMIANVRYT